MPDPEPTHQSVVILRCVVILRIRYTSQVLCRDLCNAWFPCSIFGSRKRERERERARERESEGGRERGREGGRERGEGEGEEGSPGIYVRSIAETVVSSLSRVFCQFVQASHLQEHVTFIGQGDRYFDETASALPPTAAVF